METTFSLKKFLTFIFIFNILVYLGWSFVEFSFYEPIYQTFKTTTSRGMYLVFLLVICVFGTPYYLPFKS